MEFRDYYAVLGVPRTATDKEIRAAFRKQARRLHPDVNKDPKATEAFKRVSEAHEVLKDPKKRAKYDSLGADWERVERETAAREQARRAAGAAGAGGRDSHRFSGFSDFFETFFGGRAGGGPGADPLGDLDAGGRGHVARRGPDAGDDVAVTLAEAIRGGQRTLRIALGEPCAVCRGQGIVAATPAGGSGRTATLEARACEACQGTGQQTRQRTLNVEIPAGVVEGARIRVAGEGGRGRNGGAAGDLYLTVRLQVPPGVTVRGRDLHADLPVRDYRAVLGGQVTADGPSGRVEVTLPPGCPAGRVFRLRGKGIPALRGAGTGGDLYLTARITTSGRSPLPPAERDAYQALARADGVRDPA